MFFVVDIREKIIPIDLLDERVTILCRRTTLDLKFLIHFFTSKYVFLTHGSIVSQFPDSQVAINLWHGLFYKKVGMLIGGSNFITSFTVGTAEITKKMFSSAFGVDEGSVTDAGYPRNDFLFDGLKNKRIFTEKLGLDQKYQKIILWMPTYRASAKKIHHIDGIEVGNPFYIKNFDVQRFNQILKNNNALCVIKPHPMAPVYGGKGNLSNLLFIDNEWIYEKGLDLYQFVGLTDILISDVSSIIFDYMLLDQPIICISEDFEEYKSARGFYFDDIEEKIPTKVLLNQNDFFKSLENILETGIDPYEEKRVVLKNLFFKYQDDYSTERLIDLVFNKDNNDFN